MKTFFIINLLIFLLLLAACGQVLVETTNTREKPADNQNLPVGDEYQVVIDDNLFTPQDINIKTGDIVTWTNQGSESHTVTSWYWQEDEDLTWHVYIGQTWDSGDIEPGESYSKTFNYPGSYDYFSFPLLQTPATGTVPLLEPAITGGKVVVTYSVND